MIAMMTHKVAAKKRWQTARTQVARGQAAIFDGIMFLLITSFSCALIFSFIQTYGQSEDNAMRSAYELNFLQSVLKTIYYLDAETLAEISSDGLQVYKTNPDIDDDSKGCKALSKYKGRFSVIDLFKRDLADNPKDPLYEPLLNDRFDGTTPGKGPFVPGRTGMRCAMKELMKPITFAGYDYFVEVVVPGLYPKAIPVERGTARVTNNLKLVKDAITTARGTGSGCDFAQEAGWRVLSLAAPFRVSLGKTTRDYQLRLCVWPRS